MPRTVTGVLVNRPLMIAQRLLDGVGYPTSGFTDRGAGDDLDDDVERRIGRADDDLHGQPGRLRIQVGVVVTARRMKDVARG